MVNTVDMCLFFTKNHDICSVEGWWHPNNKVISNIIYLNDDNGNYIIYDKNYIKLTRKDDGKWRTFEEQENIVNNKRILEDALFIKYKKFINKEDINYFTNPFEVFLKFKIQRPEAYKITKKVLDILKVEEKESNIGIVGSYQIGIYNEHSDIDIMFKNNIKTNLEIFKNIKKLSEKYPVYDRNKKLPLRFFYNNVLFCCHFAYENDSEIFKGFSTNYIKKCAYKGTVEITDITHSIYTPTVLKAKEINNKEELWLVIYHGGEKGEFNIGDTLKIDGELIENEKIRFINLVKTSKI